MIEEFMQEFRRIARENSFKGRLLVEEFKRGMNKVIRRKLIEVARPPTSIEQQYKHATNLDRYWRESRRGEKILKRKRKNKNQGQKQGETRNQEEFRL